MYQIVNQPLTISPLIENEEDRQRPILFRSGNFSSNTSAAYLITAVMPQNPKIKNTLFILYDIFEEESHDDTVPGGNSCLALKNKM